MNSPSSASLRIPSVEPNLRIRGCRKAFSWGFGAKSGSTGFPVAGNIAYRNAVDRHVVHGRGDHVALRCLGQNRRPTSHTPSWPGGRTRSPMLCGPGIEPGSASQPVAGCLRCTWRSSAHQSRQRFRAVVQCVRARAGQATVVIGSGVAMVTSAALYRKKVAPVRDEMPTLQHILLVDEPGDDVSTSPGAPLDRTASPNNPRSSTWRRPGPRTCPAALHQWHDRHAQGRRPRTWGCRRALRHRSLRARSSCRRHLLVPLIQAG